MSYHMFFSFSTSLSQPLTAPKGTRAGILNHLATTETVLGLQRTHTYTPEGEKPRPGWRWAKPGDDMLRTAEPEVDTNQPQWWLHDRSRDQRIERMASQVREHNDWVRQLYADFGHWSRKKPDGKVEKITPKQAVEFWGGLDILDLPRELWTKTHFRDHIEHLFAVLTKGRSRGVELDCKPFTLKQAAALIPLLETELDQWDFDLRLAVPLDAQLQPYDFLASSADGGYDWCSHCGPIHSDDFHERCRVCPRARQGKCDLKNEHPGEFEP